MAYCYIKEEFENKDVNDAVIENNKFILENEKNPKFKIIYKIIKTTSLSRNKGINILKDHLDVVLTVLRVNCSKEWLFDSMASLDNDNDITDNQYLTLSNAYKSLYKYLDYMESG
jgi:hypothetical protein